VVHPGDEADEPGDGERRRGEARGRGGGEARESQRGRSVVPAGCAPAAVSARVPTRSVTYTSGGAFGFTRTDFAGMPTFTW
jgi:hypothetical protein